MQNNVKHLREKCGLTQKELGEQVGASLTALVVFMQLTRRPYDEYHTGNLL